MKKTKRPEPLTDGVCRLFSVADASAPGDMPREELCFLYRLAYARRAVGVQRKLLAMQEHSKVDMRIRCFHRPDTQVNQVVEIGGDYYRIRKIESPPDIVPRVMDLDLERSTTRYEPQRLD